MSEHNATSSTKVEGTSLSSSNTPTSSRISNRNSIEDDKPEAFTGESASYSQNVNGEDLEHYDSTTEASRSVSRRITNRDSLIEKANDTNELLPKMGDGKDYPPPLGDRSPYVVSFDGVEDPTHPHNYKMFKKVYCCAFVVITALSLTLGSAMFAEGSEDIVAIYHVGQTVATLGTSLFVFGFASGPIIWGPLSELYGRRLVLVTSCFGYTCFSFAVATGKDIQTIMICRFFAGFVGAAPLVVAPAVMADLFGPRSRGKAINIFAMVVFGGPMLAPILGGFTVKNPNLGYRWLSYFSGIVGALAFVVCLFLLPETHHAIILVQKAEVLRRRTGNWGIHAPHEEISLSFKEIFENNISRPLIMVFTEPIILAISIYNAFIYGLLYLFLTVIPLIFIGEYGWSQGVGELPYLGMFTGVLIGGLASVLLEKRYRDVMDKNGGKPVPEERLIPMMFGSVFFAGGIFWLGWAGGFGDRVHWIVPTLGTVPIGIGLIMVFMPCMSYIIDCYLVFAASALAGNTFIRSAFGAAFPLFARQMFVNMKIKWAATLLGCFACLLIPVPFLFYKYGSFFRRKSKYAFEF